MLLWKIFQVGLALNFHKARVHLVGVARRVADETREFSGQNGWCHQVWGRRLTRQLWRVRRAGGGRRADTLVQNTDVLYSIEKALTRRKPCTNHTAMYFGLPDQFQRCCAASGHGSEAELGSYVSVSVESASFWDLAAAGSCLSQTSGSTWVLIVCAGRFRLWAAGRACNGKRLLSAKAAARPAWEPS